MGYIHVKIYEIWISGPGEDVKMFTDEGQRKTDDGRRTTDAGRRSITIPHFEP